MIPSVCLYETRPAWEEALRKQRDLLWKSTVDSRDKKSRTDEVMAPITVHIKCANAKKYSVSVEQDKRVSDLKFAIEAMSDIPATHQRLIHKGKVLKDEEGLATYTIDNDSTVHLVRAPSATTTSAPPASTHTVPPPPSSTTPAPPFPPPTGSGATNPFAALMGGAGGGLGGSPGSTPPFQAGSNPMFGGLGMGPGGFPSAQEQQRMQQQLMQNPEMMDQVMQSPLMQQMMNSPELMRSMMMANPQISTAGVAVG
ncbi:ubiquitin family expressed [Nannochloropsis gaditana]|uniref:Ubiquitin family expressed n=1 Tax=Nannochloropsis gaditana TaxID=72520 RepID=W7TLZ1_9STRA|nr:ubiquitin family expressed [Nannochloropsis gaditana]